MAATQPQADVALDDLLAQLMEQPELEEEDLAQRIAAIEQKSAELGWNKVSNCRPPVLTSCKHAAR
jgi:hypothetical protein